MSRVKLFLIVGIAIVVVAAGGFGVWLLRRARPPVAVAPAVLLPPPSPEVTLAPLKTEIAGSPGATVPTAAALPPTISTHLDPAAVLILPPGSRGGVGEAQVTTLAQVLTAGAPEPTPREEAAVIVIPTPAAGAPGAPGVPAGVIVGTADPDNDGLTNDQELQLGTDLNRADTDGDGLIDGDEVRRYRTDPKVKDTDADGLSDGEELNVWKTDPLNPDTDGDGYKDGTEVKAGYNPKGPGKL